MPSTGYPARGYSAGEFVFIRAQVLEASADYFQVRIADRDSLLSITTWAPVTEIAKFEDIPRLVPLPVR